jgi:hypothetical protein
MGMKIHDSDDADDVTANKGQVVPVMAGGST